VGWFIRNGAKHERSESMDVIPPNQLSTVHLPLTSPIYVDGGHTMTQRPTRATGYVYESELMRESRRQKILRTAEPHMQPGEQAEVIALAKVGSSPVKKNLAMGAVTAVAGAALGGG
jgi:hypothetical protein